MGTQYEIAGIEDYEEVIDLANYVFSAAYAAPHDFPALLPKLCRREYFMDAFHYIARENGKIKAVVGAYPLKLRVCGESLAGRGVGMVSAHPYARSMGYMRVLMDMALADMRRDSIAFSCLHGLRQRYEYFGFTPSGAVFTFECSRYNVRHFLGAKKKSASRLKIKKIHRDDKTLLEKIRLRHEAKQAYFERKEDRFFDILSSWNSEVFAVCEEELFIGYGIFQKDENAVTEINFADDKDLEKTPEMLSAFFDAGFCGDKPLAVSAQPHEREKLAVLSRFAESCRVSYAYNYRIFDYRSFVSAFIKLKNSSQKIAPGHCAVQIKNADSIEKIFLFAENGAAGIADSGAEGRRITLDHLTAMDFLFSPTAPYTHSRIAEEPFLQSLLPLPLFCENADGI